MRGFFTAILFIGLLPAFAVAQGIRMDSEEFEDSDMANKSQIKKEEEYYMEAETYEVSADDLDHAEIYTGAGANRLFNEQASIMQLDSKIGTLNKGPIDVTLMHSSEYQRLYKDAIKRKTKMIRQHEEELEKKGDTLERRKAQMRELRDLTLEASNYRKLEKKAYEQERTLMAQQEVYLFQQESRDNLSRYGIPLPESELHRRTYERIKRDIEDLKESQSNAKMESRKNTDQDNRHFIERGRLDDEFHKARERLEAALAKEGKSFLP